MNWSKIKTILIIALLLTNVFLIATLDLKPKTDKEVENETALINMLEEHGIFVDVEIPKMHDDMGTLLVKYADVDEALIESEMAKVQLSTKNELTDASYKNAADKFIESIGLYSDSVSAQAITLRDKKAEVFYTNVIGGVVVDDCYMDCSFEDGKMVDFKYKWLVPISISGETSTISASVALLRFMASLEAEEEIHISEIKPVYWLDENAEIGNAVSDTAFAYWKITYNDNNLKYIIAYEQ